MRMSRRSNGVNMSEGQTDRARHCRAKAESVYKGRPALIDVARVREMKAQGMGATAIAKVLSVHRASVHRLLEHRP
jgi:DNA invertase Pin-like site-specific DNA recombinase